MTIDVEDYFHVSVFDGVVPRVAVGPHREPRRARNTERLLDMFDETGVRAHVLRARLGRRAASRSSCARIAGARPRGRVARLRAPAGLRPDAGGVPRGRAAREGAARGRCRRAGARLPRAELLDHAALAVGARRADRGRLRVRREHLPDPPRSLRHSRCRRGIRTSIDARGGTLVEVPGVDRPRRAGRICRWPAAATSGSCRMRGRAGASRRVNRRRAAAGDLLPASVGDRSGAAAASKPGC